MIYVVQLKAYIHGWRWKRTFIIIEGDYNPTVLKSQSPNYAQKAILSLNQNLFLYMFVIRRFHIGN